MSLDLFIQHGFQNVSMDAIAAAAGMSKQTLYRHFTNKEDLFAQAVQRIVERAPIVIADVGFDASSLTVMLRAFGRQLARAYGRDDAVGMFRMVIGESSRKSDLGRQFHGEIVGVAADPLSRQLAIASERGLITLDNPFEAAIRFIAVLKEHFLWPRLLGQPAALGAAKSAAIVDSVIRDFLRAHRKDPGTAPKLA